MSDLAGPQLPPKSGSAHQLVVLLHGVGADGNDLIGLAPMLAERLPDAAFVAPNAPDPFDMAPFGHQWFSLRDTTPAGMLVGVQRSAPVLDRFLDETLAAHGLDDSSLALLGFSQGTMMALYVALRRARPVAGVLGYSGALLGAELLGSELRSRPPVCLIHGDADEVVPVEATRLATETLEALRVPVRATLRPGLGHGIDPEGLAIGLAFLEEVLGRHGR